MAVISLQNRPDSIPPAGGRWEPIHWQTRWARENSQNPGRTKMLASFPNLYLRPHTRVLLALMPQISTAPHSPPMATSSATSCTYPMPQIETPPKPPTMTTPSSTTPSLARKPLPAAPLCFYPLKPPIFIRWGPQVGAHTPG